jgi:GDP-L-fucose synthase
MEPDSRIFVAGHAGLVGSALRRRLEARGYSRLILRTRAELDLTDRKSVHGFFEEQRPDYVFLAAAKVGGILANNTYPAVFIHDNLEIQTNIIHECWRSGVKRLLFMGSSCIYPRDCPQPMKEEHLLTGPLEPTNRPYALAKIAGVEMCWAYNRQYGTNYLATMPTNLYGPGDNYDLQDSHVLPALIRKMDDAVRERSEQAVVWGTGRVRREFLYSDDLAEACLMLMNLPDADFAGLTTARELPPMINIGCGEDLTVRELAETVARVVGFRGRLAFDSSKPDGVARKLLDTSRINALGWRPTVALAEGIDRAYRDFSTRKHASSK